MAARMRRRAEAGSGAHLVGRCCAEPAHVAPFALAFAPENVEAPLGLDQIEWVGLGLLLFCGARRGLLPLLPHIAAGSETQNRCCNPLIMHRAVAKCMRHLGRQAWAA